MPEIDIHRIREILPHRYPFLLVDRVLDHDDDKSLRAVKNVTANEPFFQGHFPQRPIFPGVLMLEAMAQAAAIMASLGLDQEREENMVYLYAGIDKARFKRQVEPGDQMMIDVKLLQQRRSLWRCGTIASVDGQVCCSAEVLFTYRIV
ncbi:MAG: 3-hydroxyacyl-ACP dehydratase FabZ [Arenicellales bacterium WSBS_2016_MAG_OTU3]